jgi:hypothetical protein
VKQMKRGHFRAVSKNSSRSMHKENSVMKKSIISAIALTATICAFPMLQSCADSSRQTTYTTTSDPSYGYSPAETTTTTTTTTSEPDSVVGATANAAGTIVEAPFRIVGDTLGILF